MRLDQFLVLNGYFESRNKASAAVKEGCFAVDGKRIFKPSFDVGETCSVTLLSSRKTYVARSAHKLLRAYEVFQPKWENLVAADLGASTGGFCQVLLENNIQKIYAVDIGTNQLHPSVKSDDRVVNLEHINARYLTESDFPEAIQVVTADLSFISIKAVIPAIQKVLVSKGQAILLIKPQFEAGPNFLNKAGVVSDRKIHYRVVEDIALFSESCGFGVRGIAYSGLAGESGNREYLLFLEKDSDTSISISSVAYKAVFSEE